MDREEFQRKIGEVNELAAQKNYKKALEIVEDIDWRKVKNVRVLCTVGEVYAANRRYEDSRDIFLLAYKRAPVGKTILYRLIEVSLKMGDLNEALNYYHDFINLAPNDSTKYILKYKIYKARKAPLEDQIQILEEYKEREYTERWVYELARLYYEAGKNEKCIETCDDLTIWFRDGKYVAKSLELKGKIAELTPSQKEVVEQYHDFLSRKKDGVKAELETENPEEEEKIKPLEKETGEKEEVSAEETVSDAQGAEEHQIEEVQEMTPEEVQALEKKMENAYTEEELFARRVESELLRGMEDGDAESDENVFLETGEEFQEKVSQGIRELFKTKRVEDVIEYADRIEAENQKKEEEIPHFSIPSMSLQETVRVEDLPGYEKNSFNLEDTILAAAQAQGIAVPKDNEKKTEAAELPAEEEKPTEPEEVKEEVPEQPEEGIMDKEELIKAILSEPIHIYDEAEEELPEEEAELPAEEEKPAEPETVKEEAPEQPEEAVINEEKLVEAILSEPIHIYDEAEEELPEEEAELPAEEEKPAEPEAVKEEAPEQPEEAVINEEKLVEAILSEPIHIHEEQEEIQEYDAYDEEYISEKELEEAAREFTAEGRKEEADAESLQGNTQEYMYLNQDNWSEEEKLLYFIDQKNQDGEARILIPRAEKLDDDEISLFKYFSMVPGIKEQLVEILKDTQMAAADKTSMTGNVIIMGNRGAGKTTLAGLLIKAICRQLKMPAAKVARVTAEQLEGRDMAKIVSQLAGGFLLIQDVNQMSEETVQSLNKAMEFRTDGLTVILEDEKIGMRKFIARNPKFIKKFTCTMNIPVFTNDELVNFAKIYTREMGYKIDEMGILALYTLISENQKEDEPMTVGSVKYLLDDAIARAESSTRKLQRNLSKTRKDKDGLVILYEKDFK